MPENSGDTQFSGHFSFNGFDVQGSCALTNDAVIIANYNDLGTVRDGSSTNYTIDKHNFRELGAGLYTKNSAGNVQELMFIVGNGMTSRFSKGGDTLSGQTPRFENFKEVQYNRYVLQADFGTNTGTFSYTFSSRIFIVHYYNINDNVSNEYKNLRNTFLYADGAVTLRYKILQNLYLAGQASLTLPITGYNITYYESSPFNCSAGVILDMNIF